MTGASVTQVPAAQASVVADALAELDRYRDLPAAQQPQWPDPVALGDACAALAARPPLAVPAAADRLSTLLAAAGRGEAFVLQGGDCAETFAGASADRIRRKIRTLLQMAVILTHGASMPVVKMGRMAGQFAKPRSSNTEVRDGVTLPVYRGDMVNDFAFTPAARRPDPGRLLRASEISAATWNVVQAFTAGGWADLRRVHDWNRGFMRNPAYARYEQTAAEIDRAMRFMDACGADSDAMRTVEFFVSHEALILDYERALTRADLHPGTAYDTSAHFLWLGERTRDPGGAHAAFLARIANPIGVKLGPHAVPGDVAQLVARLNPDNTPGRLTFITRMGAGRVRAALPPLVTAARAAGWAVTWVCDPMHGNTITSTSGYKTRRFDDVLDEVRGFFDVHRECETVPGGLHVELTGDDVTEVLGGQEHIEDTDLALRYETLVDPRLNHQQSLELAFEVAAMLRAS
jgi:3-deoxy-7-phosphoheptulonate synthase